MSRASKSLQPHPFVQEQSDALGALAQVDYVTHYLIKQGGIKGYLSATIGIWFKLLKQDYDVVHAHYGLSALPAMLAAKLSLRKVLSVATFHGSDLNDEKERGLSQLASRLADWSIVVSARMKGFVKGKVKVIPCGIDIQECDKSKEEARASLGFKLDDFVVLFCSSFDRPEKNPDFAKRVIERFRNDCTKNVVFLELKGMNREQVTRTMVASDVLLMCSTMEGSPQVIKEAIFNGLPVLSNDIGEVSQIVDGVIGAYVVTKEEDVYVRQLMQLAENSVQVTFHQDFVNTYDNRVIAEEICSLYLKA